MKFCLCGALLFLTSLPLGARTPLVEVALVEANTEQSVLTLVGELRALRRSVLSAEVAGVVAEVLAERGDEVKSGAVLTAIREQPAQFALRSAKGRNAEAGADVDRAILNERRIGRLLQRKAASQDEYDSAQVELNKARAIQSIRRAELDRAADQLTRHRVRAPYPSVVVDRMVELGQWLDVGDPCYAIEDIARLRAVFAVPQQYFPQIETGSQVALSFEARPSEVFSATLTRKLPRVRQQGRSFEIWVDLDNSEQRLVSGFSAKAQVPLHRAGSDPLLVPRDAVLRARDGSAWLWRVQSGEAHRGSVQENSLEQGAIRNGDNRQAPAAHGVQRVAVEVVAAVGDGLLVRSDELAVGMLVIVRGNETLREGQSVRTQMEQ